MKIKATAISLTALLLSCVSAFATEGNPARDERACRNFIVQGNKLYKEKRYAEAEVMYQKALQADPASSPAKYNLAASYFRQGKTEDLKDENSLMSKGRNMLSELVADPKNPAVGRNVMENAFYNLGNLSFNEQNYSESIEMYKGALRINPANNLARENLRLAQLKLKEQQQDQQNKNQDQDKNKDQNQDNKDQDKDKNKDQNKDEDKNKDQDKDKQQPQDPKKDEQKQQPPQQQQGDLTDENAAKILKTMENEEAATRRRIQQQQGRQKGAPGRPQPAKPW